MDSTKLKYDRYYPNKQLRKLFNDILGFRAYCDNYEDILNLYGGVNCCKKQVICKIYIVTKKGGI